MNSNVNITDFNVRVIFKILLLNHSILRTVKEVKAFGGDMKIFIKKVGLFYASFYLRSKKLVMCLMILNIMSVPKVFTYPKGIGNIHQFLYRCKI